MKVNQNQQNNLKFTKITRNESKIPKIEINPVTQIESKLMKCTKINENESKLSKIERIQ